MILSDNTIQKMIADGKLIAKDEKIKLHINPASVDLHLGTHYLTIEDKEMSVINLDCSVEFFMIVSGINRPASSFLLIW